MQKLTVELGDQRDYPIYIGSGLLDDASYLMPHIQGRQVCIVTNTTIAPLYLDRVKALLTNDYQIDVVILPDGEQYKQLDTINQIYDCLLEGRHNRTTTLIALGGGVVGDMTGFAAATYQRGVNFIQIPTTLLAQVDSSVGGKTGVNHPLGKNMIGAFHQPEVVIIDIDVLQTLPSRELSAGIAEIIKYGLINDAMFYSWLESNIASLMSLDAAITSAAILKSCQSKACVVSADEKESGLRATLNFGHTFAHAIEAAQGYGQWLHGEAVATGMLVALDLSARMGWVNKKEVARLRYLLETANLPVTVPENMTERQFLDIMAVDKKVLNGKLRLVLLKSVGCAIVTEDAPQEKISQSILACR
ncbi:MAG: 3-dehydroquinate synthase [Pseudohongiellaceae bacterium]|jgi:3-dehydroquinate synthase